MPGCSVSITFVCVRAVASRPPSPSTRARPLRTAGDDGLPAAPAGDRELEDLRLRAAAGAAAPAPPAASRALIVYWPGGTAA